MLRQFDRWTNGKIATWVNYYIFGIIITTLFFVSQGYAESIKFVQWWDEYFPQKYEQSGSYAYSRKITTLQFEDLDDDGIKNDTLVCEEFSM
ncbi:MAG: hypothetical protein BWK79_15535, partial [Beggiatoa sp. IS2]